MSYEKLLLSAREQGNLRLQQKGLGGKRERKFVDNEIDTALLTGEGIGKKSLIPSRNKESEPELDFMTDFFNRLQASNKSLKEQVKDALVKAGADEPEVKGMENVKPRSRDEGGSEPSLDKKASELFEDESFKQNFSMILDKYPGLTRYEMLRMIDGESGMNPSAQNKDSKAAGLFQFKPVVAAELGFTTEEIKNMPASEQLLVYERYLDKYKYDGSYSLGILQAAPAKRNASPDTIIYRKGSKAWKQNPGWRDSKSGHITKASIDAYYRRTM
jgi:hypothetical protein